MRGRKFEKKLMDPKKKKVIIISIIFAVIILTAGGILAYKILSNQNAQVGEKIEENTNEQSGSIVVALDNEKKFNIYSGTRRPIAVMIDNHKDAQPQGGLNNAYLVYEIIAEGGESRLMALFKGANVEKIGPVRSARHYFLDYALENDAIYVHYGWSPQAKSDITTLGVNNINGIYESETSFWRDSSRYAPHNAVTSTENILKIAKREEYRTTTTKDPVLNYVVDEVNLEEGQEADKITIPYSDHNTVKYTYDEKNKEYTRYSRGEKQTDWNSDKTVTTKNIIITFAKNESIDSYGRQNIDNIKTLDGYYITNGKAIKIKCEKTSRSSQTVYKDLEGNEINVNDGKTFIQICPIDADVTIEGNNTSTVE